MTASRRNIGPLTVHTDPVDARALTHAVDPDADTAAVPLIFPIRWLALPEIGQSVGELVDLSAYALVHEGQAFEVHAAMASGADYLLQASLTRTDGPPLRLSLAGTLSDLTGAPVAELTATLRALPLAPR